VNVGLVLAALVGGVVVWWLLVRKLTAKPWERKQSETDNETGGATLTFVPSKVGLWVLMAVITSFFGLFFSAYGMRMHKGDWQPLDVPQQLWFNTGLLIASSAAFEWTRRAARHGEESVVRRGLLVAGFFALAFIAAQLAVWRQLNASGHYVASSAAVAFFYVLTALHGLHLLGGLVVWGKATARIWTGAELADVRLSVELCTVYWHFLLVVWVAFFALLFHTD
jgi:cytochrome c oxidase subunit III